LILVLLLLAFSGPTGRAQMQPPTQTQGDPGLPDFSGFNLIDSFARLPAERTNLSTLCDVRRTSIDEITGNIEGALTVANETTDPAAAVRLHNAMGVVFLYKGDIAAAIPQFEEGVRIAHQHSTEDPKFATMESIDLAALGIAQMRRGEVENCAVRHTADMCIFPLSLGARHTLRSGSERALEYFEHYLEREPSSLEVRCLLNVAYQTLGGYPDKVPKAYLIPPAAFEGGHWPLRRCCSGARSRQGWRRRGLNRRRLRQRRISRHCRDQFRSMSAYANVSQQRRWYVHGRL
jgi:hypothetical protein